jgi:hypothetical protein
VSELSEMVNSIITTFEPKNPLWDKGLMEKSPQMVELLPLLDTFRTLNWTKIKSEYEFMFENLNTYKKSLYQV